MAKIPVTTLARATAAAETANDAFSASFLFPSVLTEGMPVVPDDGAKVCKITAYRRKGLDNLRQPNGLTTLAAKGQRAQQISMSIESYTADAAFYTLEKLIDEDELATIGEYGFTDYVQGDVVPALVHGILNDREYRARDKALAAGSYASGNTLAGSSAGFWDDLNVNPIAQLEQARNQLNRFGAFNATDDGTVVRMLFSSDAFDAFRSNPFVRSAFFGDSAQGFATEDFLDKVRSVLSPNRPRSVELRIADASAQNANQGRADNPALIWSRTAVLFVSQADNAQNALRRRAWGRGYRPSMPGMPPNSMWSVKQYREEATDTEAVKIKTVLSEEVFDPTCGFLFSGITTP
jgi:hypothetical protein